MCNMMLPVVGEHLGLETSNKEGWLSGLLEQVMGDEKHYEEGEDAHKAISLALAFPVGRNLLPEGQELLQGTLEVQGKALEYYGFYENTEHPECYDETLEHSLKQIIAICRPDVVHIFGTEYPHTLAMTRAYNCPERTLIGVQGLCSMIAEAYLADLPERVVRSKTLRDVLKQDSIRQQQEKFALRGKNEIEAILNVGHITGRTHWDREQTTKWNPTAVYHEMNETLRSPFYTGQWQKEQAEPGAIFVSQGDYPLKGLHYMLLAMPMIREHYPEAKIYVAGNSIIRDGDWKERLKISAYGNYLKKLIKELDLQDRVSFLGKLSAEQMKEQYLKSSAYVCCSTVENSPNSLGEAMLLGVPCVAADVGGVSSLLIHGVDGILYQGFDAKQAGELEEIAGNLAKAILALWGNSEISVTYCENARVHAKITHDGRANYEKLMEIYADMNGESAS